MGAAGGGSVGSGRRPAWIARVAKPSAIGVPLAVVGRQGINRGAAASLLEPPGPCVNSRGGPGAGQDPGPEAVALGGAADGPDHPHAAAGTDAPPPARPRARKRLPWAAPRTPRTTRTPPSRPTSRVRRPDTSTADSSPDRQQQRPA